MKTLHKSKKLCQALVSAGVLSIFLAQQVLGVCYGNAQTMQCASPTGRNYPVTCSWFPYVVANCTGTTPGCSGATTYTTASGFWTTSSSQGICTYTVTFTGTCCGGAITSAAYDCWFITSFAQFTGCPGGSGA